MQLPGLSGLSRLLKWITALALLAAAFFAWRGYTPIEVRATPVVMAYPSQGVSVLNATGYVVAQRKASLSTKATGRLEWLGVAEGSMVRAGEVVARLESRDVLAQLEQAKAQVGVAQAEFADAEINANRSAQLLAQRFISAASHDAALARLNKARASLAATAAAQQVAEANLAQTEIRAPFNGVVLTKNANVGDNITPFSSAAESKGAVITIADMSTLEVEADVSESSLGKLRIGQPAEIGLDALPGERFSGSIARMVPTIDRSKATRMIKIRFDTMDPRVLPDMSAKVVFLERPLAASERKPFLAVSRQAVIEREGRMLVYLIDGDRLREVSIGPSDAASSGELIAVSQGALKAGQRLVIRPVDLTDGQRVKVVSP
jgi:HlyD family secretion protein